MGYEIIDPMLIKKILLFIIPASLIFASPSFLSSSHSGDYVVAESGKMLSLIHIHSKTDKTVLLEEISIPINKLKPYPTSWPEWVHLKAPQHSSWSMLEIDLENGQVLECYSFSKNSFSQVSKKESLLANLLTLPLNPVKKEALRRIGPPPLPGEKDVRKIWSPPLVFEGNSVKGAHFNVKETFWPQDGSDLQGSKITLYFDAEQKIALPVWIDADTSHMTFHFHVIDSGKNLKSPMRTIPRRSPQFLKEGKQTDTGMLLSLKSPPYFLEFSLFAIDCTKEERKIIPVACHIQSQENETVVLKIEKEDVLELDQGGKYQWLICPIGYEECTEISKTFTLKKMKSSHHE